MHRWAAEEVLLTQSRGGGYIFLHRMLLEYFATLEEPSGRPDQDLRASARRFFKRLKRLIYIGPSWELTVTRLPPLAQPR